MSRLSAALNSATQHAMPPEFGRKWATECFNTRFPLPTLLCAGYSVKLFFYYLTLSTNERVALFVSVDVVSVDVVGGRIVVSERQRHSRVVVA